MGLYNNINRSLLGLYCNDSQFLKELQEVKMYYEFYEGRPESVEDDLTCDKGQLWAVKDRDYRPTREVRNLVKKLLKKQGRFMTSVRPSLVFNSVNGGGSERIDDKRIFIEHILDNGNFWNKFSKAFMDATIGKRVLLALITDIDENGKPVDNVPIKFRFYTMPEFTFEYDPNDIDKLQRVQIAYIDDSTVGRVASEQRWHKWVYEMREGSCWATYELVDGTGTVAFLDIPSNIAVEEQQEMHTREVEIREEWNTGLSKIPCKVIFNDGLTGDIRGHSDVKDLMDIQNSYNKTLSDYRDALRFTMFGQTTFIDADSSSIAGVKIAPGAIIDLKSDPSLGDGVNGGKQAKVQKVESSFTFESAANSYLERLKRDMYEIMDQPLPETLVNVASGKALRMLSDDLISRCEEKWQEWDEALVWLTDLIVEVVLKCNLYTEHPLRNSILQDTTLTISHNYPIPDDELDSKSMAIKEVESNVRSIQSYIRQYGMSEEADKELQEILDEKDKLATIENGILSQQMALNYEMSKEEDTEEDTDEDKEKNQNVKK
jgi:hypothetical protein